MSQNKIRTLDEKTINLIAAGEVVESPASLVKELVENAIDAEASSIIVEIRDGGRSFIRVTDDGFGISEEDAPIAFQRHTTSKIQSFQDFENLHTNGFRGEALGSIAAVSKICMVSKIRQNIFGIQLKLSGGQVQSKERIGAKEGTTVIVEELFYNTPARKKFLKSAQAETAKVTDVLIRLALANPQIRFRYISGSRLMLQTPGNNSLLDAIHSIYGNDFCEGLVALDVKREDVAVKGYIGHNTLMFSSRRNQHLFVNSRVIRGKEIITAIEEAYAGFIPAGNFPAFVIDILVTPAAVDVNIHPNKLDIKFGKEFHIPQTVGSIVKDCLNELVMIPKISMRSKAEKLKEKEQLIENLSFDHIIQTETKEPTEQQKKQDIFTEQTEGLPEIEYIQQPSKTPVVKEVLAEGEDYLEHLKKRKEKKEEDLKVDILEEEESSYRLDFDWKKARIIGVAFGTYFIAEMGSSLYLIDQHAAHERILYEKYLAELEMGEWSTQTLLMPLTIRLPLILSGQERDILNYLESKGFSVELFGEQSIALRGIPTLLTMQQGKDFVEEIINIKANDKHRSVILDDKIAMKACKAAVKARDKLEEIEIYQILQELSICKNKYACPHGRPIIVEISQYEIEKMFKRVLK